MGEQMARGIRGYLLYDPFEKRYIFRVYDAVDKKIFQDYRLCAEDIEIEILDKFVALKGDRLDYCDKALGK